MRLGKNLVLHLFIKYLKNKNYASQTMDRYTYEINGFFRWLYSENKEDIRDVGVSDILEYENYLGKRIVRGKRLSKVTINMRLKTLSLLFKFLIRFDYVLINPFDRMDLAIKNCYSGRTSVSQEAMSQLLNSIELNDRTSIRDRCLLEIMYGTGLRLSEIRSLKLRDLNLNEGSLLVRQGKGKKDRVVPLGACVIEYVKIYLKKARKHFLKRVKDNSIIDYLFFSAWGNRLYHHTVRVLIKKRARKIGLDSLKITPHIIRHSFATHMLEGGASIKHVKDILGHASLSSTVVYTHFNVKSLKRILKIYHPRENQLYEEFNENDYLDVLIS